MKLSVQFEKEFDLFLMSEKKGTRFNYVLNRKASVKDIIESQGVPHTEIGRIEWNGQEIDFLYIPLSPGILNVYAIDPPFTVLSPSMLRPVPLNNIKFIADVNVIRVGRILILLGFDVIYSSSYSDGEIADIAEKENRIVLTRDTGLLKRTKIVFARRIRSNYPYEQLLEIIEFFGLVDSISFFSRCTACNVVLESIAKKNVLHLLEPKTRQYFDDFFQCPRCKGVFWKGSHYDNIKKKMISLGIPIHH